MIYTPELMSSIEKFINWYNKLPILPYGEISDAELMDAFQIILQWKDDGVSISSIVPDKLYTVTEYWLLLGLLSHYISYGISPRGAWLTDAGKEALNVLRVSCFVYSELFKK